MKVRRSCFWVLNPRTGRSEDPDLSGIPRRLERKKMRAWSGHPVINEITAWVWMGELSRTPRSSMTFARFPTRNGMPLRPMGLRPLGSWAWHGVRFDAELVATDRGFRFQSHRVWASLGIHNVGWSHDEARRQHQSMIPS